MINIAATVDRLREILEDESNTQLKEELNGFHSADLADIFQELKPEERLECFNLIEEDKAADMIEYLPPNLQVEILGDIDTAYFMLGIPKVNPDYQDEKSLPALYSKLYELCPNLKTVATTLRYSVSASHQRIGGVLFDGKTIFNAAVQEVTPVIDRVGSGDAFMGGLIYGLVEYKEDKQKALDFAVAACCLKHTIAGDYNLVTLKEVENMAGGNSAGLVSR
jgi:2-dehydro-3-deoxygluconokinase